MNLTDLSDRELLIMKCLWNKNEPMTVNELIDIIAQNYQIAYKETTVYTFLKRLKEKGYVSSYKKGGSHFAPLVSEEQFLENYAETLANFLGKESSAVFLRFCVEKAGFSSSECEELIK